MGSKSERGTQGKGFANVVRLVKFGLVVAAVAKELSTPEDERTWNGVVAGFVPYDFRMPTVARIRERVWDPQAEHLISPHVFGVGWTLNVGRVVELVRQKVAEAS
jgi:hypothetical protein